MTGLAKTWPAFLGNRLYPKTNLHVKQFADGIQVSRQTVGRWLNGNTLPPAEEFLRGIEFFHAAGEPREKLMAELMPDIEAPAAKLLWITDRGSIHDAPAGHADFVRRKFGLPVGTPGDDCAYARRNGGWLNITVAQDGSVELALHGRGVEQIAAQKAREWLLDHVTGQVTLSVEIEGRTLQHTHETAQSAADAIADIARLAVTPVRVPLSAARLPLDQVTDAHSLALLKAHAESPDGVLPVAEKIGAMARVSILSVERDGVRSLHAGSRLRVPGYIVGGLIRARGDALYAEMIERHAIETADGPTFNHIKGPVYGRLLDYRRVVIPIGRGRVVTHSEALEAA